MLGLALALPAGAAAPAPADTFVATAFAGAPPAPTLIWYDAARRTRATAILGHPPATARVRCWRTDGRTAVVLDEIAHTQPITAGFVVRDGRIELARVLVYRESRGGAVQRSAWLDRFVGRGLAADGGLDGVVDGITGATLSVGAMTRMARLALFLAAEAGRDAAR